MPTTMLMASTPPSSSASSASLAPTPRSTHLPLADPGLSPAVPSAPLPLYYPDSRIHLPPLPSQQHRPRMSSHAAETNRRSVSGPSGRHLLERVMDLPSPKSARPTSAALTFEFFPTTYVSDTALFDHAPVRRMPEWRQTSYNDPNEDSPAGGCSGSGGGVGGGGYASGNGSRLSSSSLANYAQGVTSQSRMELTHTRYPPPMTDNNIGSYPNSGGNTGQTSNSNALTDPIPNSVGYPGTMFGDLGLPESVLAPPPLWNPDVAKVTGEDYAKVSRTASSGPKFSS